MNTTFYLSVKLNKTSFLKDMLCNLNIKDNSYGEFRNCDIWVEFRELGLCGPDRHLAIAKVRNGTSISLP